MFTTGTGKVVSLKGQSGTARPASSVSAQEGGEKANKKPRVNIIMDSFARAAPVQKENRQQGQGNGGEAAAPTRPRPVMEVVDLT